ncbi:hypothetical protein BaRGS_00025741 [Batillaria attramentaria]|uniref:Uncharacterized protein n=1 Tax=Batillaria attramentaria TaxID=370345 RepID=A0ABD0K6K9_9CAEN
MCVSSDVLELHQPLERLPHALAECLLEHTFSLFHSNAVFHNADDMRHYTALPPVQCLPHHLPSLLVVYTVFHHSRLPGSTGQHSQAVVERPDAAPTLTPCFTAIKETTL